MYIALERGYFTEQGIVPDFTTLDTGARAIPALATGQLDVTGGGFSPAYVNAALRGVGMKMVAALMRSEPGSDVSYVLVRKDLFDTGAVRDWSDLRGRTIAVASRGSVNDYMVSKGLALGGVGYGDVDWVELSFPDQTAGLANGTVDAALSTDPLATLVAERGLAVKWHAVSDYLPGASPAFMSYAPAFMSEHPEAARRFMAAYLRGARDYNAAFRRGENRDDAVQILIKHTTVKDAALYDRMAFGLIDPNGTINVASVADQIRWYGEQGLLQGTIEVDSLLDTSYLDAALARLGPYQP